MSDKLTILNEENFDELVIKSDKVVFVDFWAPWCGPCKMLGPIYEKLADSYGDKIVFGKVNVDENQSLAIKYNIQGIPSILIFKEGQVAQQALIGVKQYEEYEKIIQDLLPSANDVATENSSDDSKPVVDVVGKEQLDAELKSAGNKVVFVDFWAPWCGPCKALGPILHKLADDNAADLKIIKVNVDLQENQQLAVDYGVSSIPQVNFFKNSESIGDPIIGMVGAERFEEVLNVNK